MEYPSSPPPAYASLEGTHQLTKADTSHTDTSPGAIVSLAGRGRDHATVEKTRAERTVGIDDMPTEILRSILLLAGTCSCDDLDLQDLRSTQATIFACSAVCYKWLCVSGSHKELWSRILDFSSQPVPILDLFLQFTHPCPFNVGHRSAPVVLSWENRNQRRVFGVIRLIQIFRRRIRELHVEWGFGGSYFLTDMCAMGAPQLEVITWHDISYARRSADDPRLVYKIPKHPFKRLDIHDALIHLRPNPRFTSLTALSVYRSSSTTLPEWLDFLRSTPKLRFLSIRSSIHTDGPIPSHLLRSSVELPDLVLLTIGCLTSDEAELHIGILAATKRSPMCGLHITELPYVRNSQSRVILTSAIYKLMADCASAFELELFVDELGVTIGNVRDPSNTLGWVQSGEQKVLNIL